MRAICALLLIASTASAAEPKVNRDLPYAEPKNERQTLDVYSPTEGKNHPIVFWIHGGGWKQGDKKGVQKTPQAFVDKGFVFVSTNHRFAPKVTVKEITGDIATSIRWVHDHAKDYGGDPDTIFVMGHSSGGHLAALVCTDDRYLKAEGLSLSNIKGCVPVENAFYDIPKLHKDLDMPRLTPLGAIKIAIGENEELHRELSPVTHIAKGKNIPPFLILDCPVTKPNPTADEAKIIRAFAAKTPWFAAKLEEAGVSAKAYVAEGKDHVTTGDDLGTPDDKTTKALFEFLDGVLKK